MSRMNSKINSVRPLRAVKSPKAVDNQSAVPSQTGTGSQSRARCNSNVTVLKKKPERSWIGKRLLTYREAAEEYGLTVWALRSLVWERQLEIVQIHPGKHLLDRIDLDRLVEARKGLI
jgi:hypothetical protein